MGRIMKRHSADSTVRPWFTRRKLAYELGEMKNSDGQGLSHELEPKAAEYARLIVQDIESTRLYRRLEEKLPSQRLCLYFQHVVRKEIYPHVRQACVIRWYKRNGETIQSREGVVEVPRTALYRALQKYWDFDDVPLTLVHPLFFYLSDMVMVRSAVIKCVKLAIAGTSRMVSRLKMARQTKGEPSSLDGKARPGTIACHYVEGIDFSKRNDLNWYSGSGLTPEKVLIYIDSLDTMTGKPVSRERIQEIERYGFKWVALRAGVVEGARSSHWKAPPLEEAAFLKNDDRESALERWALKEGNDLLESVHRWRSFYAHFNVRLSYIAEEGFSHDIAQAIAFDVSVDTPGAHLGKQRSELFRPIASLPGYYPKHVFFTWNQRFEEALRPNFERIESIVIVGYPNSIFTPRRVNYAQMLKSRGAKFVIALFDNIYGPDIYFSRTAMIRFYQAFLQLVIDDPAVGLIIKSKKPFIVDSLTAGDPFFKAAIETGRCIKVEDVRGRFPTDASWGADLAVGCGIATSVMESVLAGCRGVHYDMTGNYGHAFYSWGYKKVIFDDIQSLIDAVRCFVRSPAAMPFFGDWSSFMPQIDPFRDGKGGERMGTYMRWLLEAFESGRSRAESILVANKLYAEKWGVDKVIWMTEHITDKKCKEISK